ncbi:DUF1499 domain-containing protein [Dasania marina]|uniref:DUF1499 domain-containing protein n=1 Tax=Dasania marina TaxID=471499 RepID=UPI000A073F49|nr:DUF1499 domain-containing protein [Dasania marina]
MSKTTSFAKLLSASSLFMLCLLPIAALGSRWQLWPYTLGLALFALALLVGLAIQVICALWLIQKPAQPVVKPLRLAVLLALPALIISAALMRENISGITLHDISTNTAQAPQYHKALQLRGEHANSVKYTADKAQAQSQLYPHIKPIITLLNRQQNFQLALATAQYLGWDIHHQNRQAGIIEAVDTSFWFGFKDDIIIQAQDQRVDIRSTSRVGESDLGANAKRISQFIAHFQTLLSVSPTIKATPQ